MGVLMAHTDDGLTGISRCLATARGVIEDRLAPVLLGQDPLETERLWQAMYRGIGNLESDRRGTVTAIGSLDIALWDLKGKILGAPVHRLLGGYRDSVPAYADGAMFYRGPDGMAEWAERYVSEGYRAVKYHVMEDGPDEVVETIRRTRRAVGPDVQIMVDVHKRWGPRLAVDTARRMEEYDVTWLEEPVTWDDEVGGMGYLSAGTRIAVAAGESEYNLYRCRDLLVPGRHQGPADRHPHRRRLHRVAEDGRARRRLPRPDLAARRVVPGTCRAPDRRRAERHDRLGVSEGPGP